MSVHDRFKNLKGRMKERTRRAFGSGTTPAQSINALPDAHMVAPSTNPEPEPPALSTPILTPPSGRTTEPDGSWSRLKGFLQVLDKSSNMFGPLRTVMSDLVQCIDLHEKAALARRDYANLKMELEALFNTLNTHFSGNVPPTMTASMDNLCSAIENELNRISIKGEKMTGRRHLESTMDLDNVMDCYRRIHGHLERLTLNADLNMWKIVDELTTEARLNKMTPSMSACYNSAEADLVGRRECTPKTRRQVLAELSDWRRDKQQGNMYWLNGMAGTGKTTIASSLCAMLDRSHKLGASFFCTRLLPECRNVRLILPTIAYQVARFSRPFRYALSQVLERDPDIHTRALSNQLEGLIIGPLREVAYTLPIDLVVVIDALDECDDAVGVGMMLEVLAKHASELPLKVFVSSRPEPQIRQKIGGTESQLVLHELDKSIVKEDIETYLRTELASMSVSESDLAVLVERAGALFIYAATAVRYIGAEGFSLNSKKRLATVLSLAASTPTHKYKEIDALYSSVLDSAFDNPNLESSDKGQMKFVLDTVICAQEPLTVDALAGFLRLEDADEVHVALRPLWSVLHISGGTSLVTTLHASFPDYMLDPTRSKNYTCKSEIHHGRLTELCFERIKSNQPQFNICGLESSYVLDEQVLDLDDRAKRAIPPDLVYACQYWAVHLVLGILSDKQVSSLDEFLSKRLLLWIEVLNLKKRINVGVALLNQTMEWCATVDISRELRGLVHDAWRFVTMFATNPVSRSTPHLYVSLLASWPPSRPLSSYYIQRTNALVRIEGPGVLRRHLALLSVRPTGSGVVSVAFSPDGLHVVSGSRDNTINVWNAINGEMLLGPLKGHTELVESVAFSSDSIRIVSGSRDSTIRVWDARTGKMNLGPLVGHTLAVHSVAFSPNDLHIASGSSDKTVRVWDAQNGQLVNTFVGHGELVCSVLFSHDGTRIFSCSGDHAIYAWDTRNGEIALGPLRGHTSSVNSIALSSDGTRIVSGSFDNTICVWSAQSGQRILGPLEGHTDFVHSVAFSPDGTRIASGSWDSTIRVWDARTGQAVMGSLEGHTDVIYSVAFSPDGMRIVSGSRDQTICIWDALDEDIVPGPAEGHIRPVNSVAFSPDGSQIASGSHDNLVFVWDVHNGEIVLGPLKRHTDSVTSVAFSPDGTRIASGSRDTTICVWDIQSGELVLGPLQGHRLNGVCSVTFSPDSLRIVSGSSDTSIYIWDSESGQLILDIYKGHTSSISSVAFSLDGMRIVSGSWDCTIRVWDAHSGYMILGPLEGHTGIVHSVVFSPSGSHIASGSGDKSIRVWDAQSGEMVLGPLEGHADGVSSLSFSPDGSRIVSGSGDNAIILWSAVTGQMMLGSFHGHISKVTSVGFSPDGTRIVSGSLDKAIRVWKLQDARSAVDEVQPLSSRMPPSLTVGSPYSTRLSWVIDENRWVLDEHGRLLFWVPPSLRRRLILPQNTLLICSEGSVGLYFDNAKVGERWIECYVPA